MILYVIESFSFLLLIKVIGFVVLQKGKKSFLIKSLHLLHIHLRVYLFYFFVGMVGLRVLFGKLYLKCMMKKCTYHKV